ncbi:MAG: alkylmercury lyase family protein, partial [Actinobacteria bacterium]|nr:alkylmercury lyase family protein [Actinomycetota bacterium]
MNRLLREGLSDLAREMATAGFAALWDGRAARAEELISGDRRARKAAAELVDRGRAEIDGQGRVVGVHGLTLTETRHGFVHGGRLHRTWCAFDSIGIPAAMNIDAEARTTCPACGRALHVPIRGGDPEVSDVALWLPSPTIGHLMADFCAVADLYCGRSHLEQRIDTAQHGGEVLDLPGAAALGRAVWADVAARGLER